MILPIIIILLYLSLQTERLYNNIKSKINIYTSKVTMSRLERRQSTFYNRQQLFTGKNLSTRNRLIIFIIYS